MTAAGVLEAVERILNRGGEPEQVVREVVGALRERGFPAAVRNLGGRAVGDAPESAAEVAVESAGVVVGSLRLAGDDALAARVATLISPYVARLP